MKTRQFLDELLFMTKAQRNASFVLVVLLVIVLVIRVSLHSFIKNEDFSEEIIQKIECLKEEERRTVSIAGCQDDIEPFLFDPNTVEYSDLLKLGFKSKTASILINYRKSGAVFKKAEDLKRVYGVDSVLISKLKEYVLIPEKPGKEEVVETVKVGNADIIKAEISNKTNSKTDVHAESVTIDLNTADTTLLKQLRGIGSVFAARICKFRDYLGGFYSVEQLSEVYNLSEETYQSVLPFVKVDTTYIRKMNINFCGVDELKKHPYCNYKLARKVVSYRSHHGRYISINDLLEGSVLSQPDFDRLSPYLTVEVEHPKAMKR
jgi:DNA uptake protein ComE-like DNA-binding protein